MQTAPGIHDVAALTGEASRHVLPAVNAEQEAAECLSAECQSAEPVEPEALPSLSRGRSKHQEASPPHLPAPAVKDTVHKDTRQHDSVARSVSPQRRAQGLRRVGQMGNSASPPIWPPLYAPSGNLHPAASVEAPGIEQAGPRAALAAALSHDCTLADVKLRQYQLDKQSFAQLQLQSHSSQHAFAKPQQSVWAMYRESFR